MISRLCAITTSTLLGVLIVPLAWADVADIPQAITDILDHKVEAWNAGDAQGWGADYADDSVVINLAGMRLEGNEENIARHAEVFAGPLGNTTLMIDAISIHQLTPDTALVETHLTVGDITHDSGALPLTESGELHTRMSFLMSNTNAGDWHIKFAQNTAIEDPAIEVQP